MSLPPLSPPVRCYAEWCAPLAIPLPHKAAPSRLPRELGMPQFGHWELLTAPCCSTHPGHASWGKSELVHSPDPINVSH